MKSFYNTSKVMSLNGIDEGRDHSHYCTSSGNVYVLSAPIFGESVVTDLSSSCMSSFVRAAN